MMSEPGVWRLFLEPRWINTATGFLFFNKHRCSLYLLLCDFFDAIKKLRGWKDCWSSPCGVPVLTHLSALLCGKITNMYHYMPLYAGAGGTDWRRVWLCSCWTVSQDRLLGTPPGRQFAKSSKEKDQRDDSKVATVDEELREAKKTTTNQSINTVGGGYTA